MSVKQFDLEDVIKTSGVGESATDKLNRTIDDKIDSYGGSNRGETQIFTW